MGSRTIIGLLPFYYTVKHMKKDENFYRWFMQLDKQFNHICCLKNGGEIQLWQFKRGHWYQRNIYYYKPEYYIWDREHDKLLHKMSDYKESCQKYLSYLIEKFNRGL